MISDMNFNASIDNTSSFTSSLKYTFFPFLHNENNIAPINSFITSWLYFLCSP